MGLDNIRPPREKAHSHWPGFKRIVTPALQATYRLQSTILALRNVHPLQKLQYSVTATPLLQLPSHA